MYYLATIIVVGMEAAVAAIGTEILYRYYLDSAFGRKADEKIRNSRGL